ncbi:fungal specific transcription factor domain-containing protein [Colletotrichum musicola]|uniref:Fungal specific transcription factor domain-containing protein n=1 Tax=Colletotrichum musicola TaxID=2175873 RepID=A0A8H6K5W1_9PEZI|nr:fungal specific transcription factor domain-containing protein [Colletotrichum musicola]
MPSGPVSRTGACQRCHRRKVRCDRTRPSCAPCARIGAQCTYAAREHQVELRRQDVERLEQRIRDLREENDVLSGRLAEAERQQQRASTEEGQRREERRQTDERQRTEERLATPASLGLQTEEEGRGSNEVASQVIHLSLSAGGGRDFVGSTSGLFLANLLQPNGQSSAGPQHFLHGQHPAPSSTLSLTGVSGLPPRSMATEIIDAYSSHDRLCYPFLSPSALDRALEAVYSETAASPVDAFLVDMALAIGTAQVYKLNWSGAWDAEVHYSRAMTRLADVLARGGVTALQGLLMVCQYRMGTTSRDTGTSVWHLIGVAARKCFELGLHRASTYVVREGNEEEVEIRRRCFCSVVAMDRIASLILGRPLAIQLDDVDAELPRFEQVDGASVMGPLTTAKFGTAEWHLGTAVFVHIVRYRLICGKILNSLHRNTLARDHQQPNTYETTREDLASDLRAWRSQTSTLPLIPSSSSPAGRSSFRSAEWYDLLYHNGILMLFRPSPAVCDASRNSVVLQHMFDSSQEAIRLYAELHRSRRINYSWVTLHSIFIAGLSYIYALRNHLQHRGGGGGGGGGAGVATLRATPSISQVVNDTRACSKVLVALSERWAMARNCSEVFDRLSDAVVADVVEAQTAPQASSSTNLNGFSAAGGDIGHIGVNLADAGMYAHSQGFVNMTVDETLRDCFGDLQNIGYDQYHGDAIAQLSQDWLFGLGETPSRYF